MNSKTQANRVLLTVFIAFLTVTALTFYLGQNYWLNLLRFALEGAVVGGMADWFAVTALFTRPLGISWHTALIPRNREKLIAAITRMVDEELLSIQTLEDKLPQLHLTKHLLGWVLNPTSEPLLYSYLNKLIALISRSIQPEAIARQLDTVVRNRLQDLELTPQIQVLAQQLLADVPLKNRLWDTVTLLVESQETRVTITNLLSAQRTKLPGFLEVLLTKSDTLNVEDAALSLQAELVSLLEEASHEPDHPLRLQVESWLKDLVTDLTESEAWQKTVLAWQSQVVEDAELTPLFEKMLQSLLQTEHLEETVTAQLYQVLLRLVAALEQDTAMVQWLEEQVNSLLSELITTQHYLIGNIVREALDSLTDDKLNLFVQSKVGQDLQWIRINGSMIGGAIGLLVYLLLYGVYRPLLLS